MNCQTCHCCGSELPDGSLRYIVEIKSFADFDGYLELEDMNGDVENDIEYLFDYIEDMDSAALEDDVYHIRTFILCKHCRERFIESPFKSSDDRLSREESRGTIH